MGVFDQIPVDYVARKAQGDRAAAAYRFWFILIVVALNGFLSWTGVAARGWDQLGMLYFIPIANGALFVLSLIAIPYMKGFYPGYSILKHIMVSLLAPAAGAGITFLVVISNLHGGGC